MATLPNGCDDPKAVIESIRDDYGVGRDGKFTNNKSMNLLQKALVIISEQLNTELAHFVLEAIQNADDNSYSQVIPSLSIKFSDGNVLITSNEKGFTSKNVHAICSISDSTKAGRSDCTGEKGIGFKSFFKVAGAIHICSRGYNFKFDCNRTCGMVIPEWLQFPNRYMQPEMTQFLLELLPNIPIAKIKKDLRAIAPTHLLFLRRLKELIISVDEDNKKVSRVDTLNHQVYNGEVRQLTVYDSQTSNGKTTEYVIVRHEIPVTHQSTKRTGIQKTEVVLAFPVNEDGPLLQHQYVYSFLPVHTTKFPFLVQADFVLTANREGLDESHDEWNAMLVRGLAQAFELAARRLIQTHLKYSWVSFLPLESEQHSSVCALPGLIRRALENAPLLYSSDGNALICSKGIYVPEKFRTIQGLPLLTSSITLHQAYSDSDLPFLKWLGVTVMNEKDFLADLKKHIAMYSGGWFQRQKHSWHAELARILINNPNFTTREIVELPIVPLQDGRWIATKDHIVNYEPSDATIMDRVPSGLDGINLVRQSASSNPFRMQLLQKLGVKQFDSRQVCTLILAQHRQLAKPTYNAAMLASHATYLFQAQHNLGSSSLWLCTMQGVAKRSSELYLDLPDSNDPVSRHLADGPAKILMLHGEIVQAVQGSKGREWRRWLMDTLGVSETFRVAKATDTSITEEFEYFLKNRPSSISLGYLIKHWNVHFPNDRVPDGVRKGIASAQIQYDDNKYMSLKKLSLDCKELRDLAPKGLPLLKLPNIEDEVWRNLKHFGVGVPDHYHFPCHCLRWMRNQENAAKEKLLPLYRMLQNCFARDEFDLRLAFAQDSLIYYEPERIWVKSTDCVWEAKRGFATKYILAPHYPDLKHLFYDCLAIENANIDMVLNEIRGMGNDLEPDEATLAKLKNLLLALSGYLAELTPWQKEDKIGKLLANQPIVPCYCLDRNGNRVVTLEPLDWGFWFYGDQERYRVAFDGVVPLADFPPSDWHYLKNLFRAGREVFGRRERCLSKAVKESKAWDQSFIRSEQLTNRFRWKGKYIRRIAIHDAYARKVDVKEWLEKTKALLQLTVYTGDALEAKPYLEWYQGRIMKPKYGKKVESRVVIDFQPGCIRICFKNKDLTKNQLGGAYFDLTRELAEFYGVHNQAHLHHIGRVLAEDDPNDIESFLTGIDIGPCEDEILPKGLTVKLTSGEETGEEPFPEGADIEAQASGRNGNAWNGSRTIEAGHDNNIQRSRLIQSSGASQRRGIQESLPNLDDDKRKELHALTKKARISGTASLTASDYGQKSKTLANVTSLHRIGRETASRDFLLKIDELPKEDDDIGVQGEYFAFQLLRRILGDSFRQHHWTSELRQYAGASYSAWEPTLDEIDASDITYFDKDQRLLKWLLEEDINVAEIWQKKPLKFHIEVKTTIHSCEERFHLSRLQKAKAERLAAPTDGSIPKDIFVIFRVFDMSTEGNTQPGLQIYIDPFKLMEEGVLDCEAEGWLVSPA